MTLVLPSDALRAHYRARFLAHGDAALATQMSREGQAFRFRKLLEIGNLDDRSVLDVGAGLGDFVPFVRARYPRARYEGVDLVPEMVACASEKYPNLRFRTADLLVAPLPERYDYVLLSAVFNNATEDPTGHLERLVARSFEHCRIGLGFNFISTHVNVTEPEMAYHDPARVLSFCLTLSRKVVLAHHYERCDVAVFAYR